MDFVIQKNNLKKKNGANGLPLYNQQKEVKQTKSLDKTERGEIKNFTSLTTEINIHHLKKHIY